MARTAPVLVGFRARKAKKQVGVRLLDSSDGDLSLE